MHDRLGSGLKLYQRISVDSATISYASYRFPEPVKGHPDSITPETKRLYDSIVIDKGAAGQPRVRDFARTLPERFESTPSAPTVRAVRKPLNMPRRCVTARPPTPRSTIALNSPHIKSHT